MVNVTGFNAENACNISSNVITKEIIRVRINDFAKMLRVKNIEAKNGIKKADNWKIEALEREEG